VITVYYDGLCGLCAREIAYYRRIAPAGIFDWQDIARNPAPLGALGITQAEALKLLHARDAEGQMHVGVAAFLLIWQQLPHWRVLARVVAWPPLRALAEVAYARFAAWRFTRLAHCQLAARE
jgi:predicted DCC family thiol-disulfide oxidoreductase YuxK